MLIVSGLICLGENGVTALLLIPCALVALVIAKLLRRRELDHKRAE